MQSKRHSIIEASSNVMLGMVICFIVSQGAVEFSDEIRKYVWKGFEWDVSAGSNLIMTIVLTIISISRGYLIRRWFNNLQERKYKGEHNG